MFVERVCRSRTNLLATSKPRSGGSFRRDIMHLLDQSNCDLWYVRHQRTGNTGYVPRNFVYAGKIPRNPNNSSKGNFLIRGPRGFRRYSRRPFGTLQEFVAYYSEMVDGLYYLSHDTQQNWEIPRNQLQLKRELGEGNFGDVWYGKWRGIVEVAIMTMKPGTMSPEQYDHPNLVELYAVCTREEPFCIIMNYMSSLGIQALVDLATQNANGMMYLEERKLVHRDMAAGNVLVGEKISGVPVVKVADFGLARKLMEEAKFPIKWTALEAATCDVWSYRMVLYELMTKGQLPYLSMQNREVVKQMEIGCRLPMPRGCSERFG
uniref:Non-specific protein-tyrosine kinase n=1 Tax=Angiostrongylus cantonensis TaxID=6313 RepID=A0A0K0DPZ2_ANGCA